MPGLKLPGLRPDGSKTLTAGVYARIFLIMKLTPDTVVEAGVRLARAEGLEAVSLRAVAVSLAVTPMALYRHVTDSDTLRTLVIERIVAGTPAVASQRGSVEPLRQWATESRAALQPYPGIANHILTHWFQMPVMLATVNDLLGVAFGLGLAEFEAVAAANAVFTFVLMRVIAEQAVRDAKAVRRSLVLPRSGLALLRERRRFYEVAQLDAHFVYGLDLIIDGISARRVA
jgi:AcrR family transcriptional regulator